MANNIVTATFNASHFVVTHAIYQYNYGNILAFDGIENLPEYFEVHFANVGDKTTTTQLGHDGQVTIPDELLDTGKKIVAYIYLHETAADGETVYKTIIPVRDREEPDDVQPTPEQQTALEAAIYALNTETGVATEAAESAEESANAASDSATVANNAASSASESATRAQNVVDGAIDDINDAKIAAVQAVRTEGETQTANAKEQADRAEGSATAAASSASQASASATNAGAYASAAATSATASLDAKTAAEQARTAAAQSATNAATAENNASTKAGEAAQSATSARDSAATATQQASAAAASATAAAGSATSAGSAATSASASATVAGNAQTAAETAQGKAEDAQEAAEAAQTAAEEAAASVAASATQIAQNTADIASLEEDRYKAFATDTASGAIASFDDGADDIPVKNLVVDIEPVQSGTGDPSPDNVRPISGWTGAKVTRTGKNLCGESFTHGIYSAENGVYYSHEGSATRYVAVGIIPVKGGQMYRMSWDNDPDNVASKSTVVFFNGDNYLSYDQNKNPFTVPDGADRIAVNLFLRTAISSISDVSIAKPQIELGSIASAYEPYRGETYSITFPGEAGTVYGGTLDVTTGKLTVERAMVTKNTADMNNASSYPGWNNAGIKALGYTGSGSVRNTLLNIGTEFSYNCNGTNDILFLGVGTYHKTQEEWIALAMEVQIIVPLPTPIEITLTPQHLEILSLYGTNNIWADAGPVDVEYRADTKLYIDKKIAAIPTASGVSF